MKSCKSGRLIIILAVSTLFLVYNPLFCQWPTSGITVYVYVDSNTNGMECWDKRNGTRWKMTSQEIYDYVRSEVIGSLNSWRNNIGLTTSQLDFQLTTDPNQYPNQLYMIKVWFKDWSQFETPECWFGNIEPPDVPDLGDWEQDNAHVCNIFLNADKRRVSWLVGTDTPPRTLDTCMTYTKYYDIDLETVILHETGHAMGYGNHLPSGSGAVLEDGYHGSRKSLTCLDINTLRDLYLKPRTYYATAMNDFGEGYLKVNGVQRGSPVSIQWTQGSTPTLEAFDQEYNGEYRTYKRWFLEDGQSIASWPDFDIVPDEDDKPCEAETYTAKFGYRFNLTLNAPEYIDCSTSGSYYKVNGTNVGDSWNGYYIEGRDNPVTIEALPGPNLAFIEWSDNGPDKYQNPRTFTPTGHTVFPVARFKGRLQSDYTISATESICPTCPNSQLSSRNIMALHGRN